MMSEILNVSDLKKSLESFANERDWEQFHSPKNLAMALASETGELLEVFQWLSESQSEEPSLEVFRKTSEELADILIYAIRLADKMGINIEEAVDEKIGINRIKYPVEKSKGNSKKYTEL